MCSARSSHPRLDQWAGRLDQWAGGEARPNHPQLDHWAEERESCATRELVGSDRGCAAVGEISYRRRLFIRKNAYRNYSLTDRQNVSCWRQPEGAHPTDQCGKWYSCSLVGKFNI
jgi:hypothetical protein